MAKTNRQKDVFPRAEALLIPWGGDFINHSKENAPRWGIPVASEGVGEHRDRRDGSVSSLDELEERYNDYKAKLLIALDPVTRTKVTIAEKNAAKNLFIVGLRHFIKEFILYNSSVTEADIISLGLTPHKKTHTAAQEATTYPVAQSFKVMAPGKLKIKVGDSEGNVPPSTTGVVCAYAVLPSPPTSRESLPHRVYGTNTTIVIEFKEEDIGKIFYYAFCWENTRGKHGYWGPIQSGRID